MVSNGVSTRSYDQYCALAKALDVVGKRWTLLLVRELLSGPKRFTDLREGLPGIGTNLLSDRLKNLKDKDIIEQDELPPPASSKVYRLTDRGEELENVIRELQKWGLSLLGEPGDEEYFNPRWVLEGLQAAFLPDRAEGVHRTFEFEIEDVIFHIHVEDGSIDGFQGPADSPDLTVKSSSEPFLKVATGNLKPGDAYQNNLIELEGNVQDFIGFLELFQVGKG